MKKTVKELTYNLFLNNCELFSDKLYDYIAYPNKNENYNLEVFKEEITRIKNKSAKHNQKWLCDLLLFKCRPFDYNNFKENTIHFLKEEFNNRKNLTSKEIEFLSKVLSISVQLNFIDEKEVINILKLFVEEKTFISEILLYSIPFKNQICNKKYFDTIINYFKTNKIEQPLFFTLIELYKKIVNDSALKSETQTELADLLLSTDNLDEGYNQFVEVLTQIKENMILTKKYTKQDIGKIEQLINDTIYNFELKYKKIEIPIEKEKIERFTELCSSLSLDKKIFHFLTETPLFIKDVKTSPIPLENLFVKWSDINNIYKSELNFKNNTKCKNRSEYELICIATTHLFLAFSFDLAKKEDVHKCIKDNLINSKLLFEEKEKLLELLCEVVFSRNIDVLHKIMAIFEQNLRLYFEENGFQIKDKNNNRLIGLGEMLLDNNENEYSNKLKELIDDDFAFTLSYLFVDEEGFNVRNKLQHGLESYTNKVHIAHYSCVIILKLLFYFS